MWLVCGPYPRAWRARLGICMLRMALDRVPGCELRRAPPSSARVQISTDRRNLRALFGQWALDCYVAADGVSSVPARPLRSRRTPGMPLDVGWERGTFRDFGPISRVHADQHYWYLLRVISQLSLARAAETQSRAKRVPASKHRWYIRILRHIPRHAQIETLLRFCFRQGLRRGSAAFLRPCPQPWLRPCLRPWLGSCLPCNRCVQHC